MLYPYLMVFTENTNDFRDSFRTLALILSTSVIIGLTLIPASKLLESISISEFKHSVDSYVKNYEPLAKVIFTGEIKVLGLVHSPLMGEG
jgi:hypothetical protein